jgi:hypothetical protein
MTESLRKKSRDSSGNVNFSPKSKKSPFSEKKGSPLSRFYNAAESDSSPSTTTTTRIISFYLI